MQPRRIYAPFFLCRQRGQALVYGLFVLLLGLASLFFMFNTGQLAIEKTRLVNTADAVAYSAGVLQARALNFDAYTNRALIANEVTVAQMVSLASWVKYAYSAVLDVPPLNCYEGIYSVPGVLALTDYLPLCMALSYPAAIVVVGEVDDAFQQLAPAVMTALELAKINLQLAQVLNFALLPVARSALMQEVADANYLGDGAVQVDTLPLTDQYSRFDGGPFISARSGDQRGRMKDTELVGAQLDQFVASRSWESHSPWACIVAPRGDAVRSGGTDLVGFDEWQASDHAGLHTESWHVSLTHIGCRDDDDYPLGDGSQSASTSGSASSSDWSYQGVPSFFDLSDAALKYTAANPDSSKRDPRIKLAIRVTRANTEARTSTGRSAVKPAGQLDLYAGREAGNVMAAVASSEVFFERPVARADGRTEFASLFNPYWQVHLVANSAADLAAAVTLQTGSAP